ncbi:MAG TPA: ATPase, T2SS/T4P/T4SS family [Clostridiaceae bacterium]|nr:ATPase, T2SS/T4P/T4SS family [Clostridiaceae bacterium]
MEDDLLLTRDFMESLYSSFRMPGYVSEYLGPMASCDLAFEYKGRYRANLFTAEGRKCAVLRVVSEEIRTLSELGLPGILVEEVIRKKGLSLVIGRTGAGKTTTLASLTREILQRENAHVITLEDPIEYRIRTDRGCITQRELGTDFVTFDEGITQALRQSPDYIVIGEIRNITALRAAISAAEAGHGILGTIHSLGAGKTLTRMLSMFPEGEKEFIRYQLSASLNFLLSQKLTYSQEEASLDYELVLNSPAVENTIREGRFNQLDNILLLSERHGMRRFQGSP